MAWQTKDAYDLKPGDKFIDERTMVSHTVLRVQRFDSGIAVSVAETGKTVLYGLMARVPCLSNN